MGAGSSIPSREQFLKETKGSSDIVSRILQWLLNESNLVDLYSLAAPSECQKYIIFTAQGLDKFFKEIQLEPRRDKDGKLYFQKISDLGKRSKRAIEEQQESCTQISFFFVRILQIFAALTLSVIDTSLPLTDDIMDSYSRELSQEKKARSVDPEQLRSIPLFARQGGAMTGQFAIKDINYSILNRYLEKRDAYFELMDGGVNTGIRISTDQLIPVVNAPIGLFYSGRGEYDNKMEIVAGLTMKRFPESSKGTVEYQLLLSRVTLNRKPIGVYARDSVTRSEGKIGPLIFTQELGGDPEYRNQTIVRFIYNEFQRILGKPIEDYDEYGKKMDSQKKKLKDIPFREMPSELQIQPLVSSLEKPVKAYCVARALQLLSPEGIYGTSGRGRISVCDKKFAFYSRASLPKPDQSIFSSYGLLTMNLLFFDTLNKTVPTIRQDTLVKYKQFLRELKFIYEELSEVPTDDVDPQTIKEAFHKVCMKNGKSVETAFTTTNNKVIAGLRGYVGQLLYRQMRHTKDVMRILGKLFVISETTPLLLHPLIQKGGMEEVEKIAEEARVLLMNYYKDCEITYREGVVFAAQDTTSLKEVSKGGGKS